jgi:hypothetical protein
MSSMVGYFYCDIIQFVALRRDHPLEQGFVLLVDSAALTLISAFCEGFAMLLAVSDLRQIRRCFLIVFQR